MGQRSTRKHTLTHSGELFHERCSGAVEGLLDAGQQLVTGSQEPSGTVRVAAMADFLARRPHVRLEFVLNDARTDLIADRIDIAFRGCTLQDSGYVGRQLVGAGNEGLVASPDYLEKRGLPVTLKDLENHDCVTFAHPRGITTWRLMGPGGVESDVQITSRFNGNTAQALRKATLAGLGIAMLPHYYRTGYGLHLLYPSRKHLPLAVSAFIELVLEKPGEQTFPVNV
ncbi:substrate binding domain-containing protein [Pseudomonas sp. DSP3-2-3]|uniref:substrate binding domain-containing protein n=1 Tax=Pseudomonas sp. DSP3-2-3 TaxID=2804563 RepID=UPI003CEEB498